MNSVDFVKKLCKERKIPVYKLEAELGFSNGYIRGLTRGSFPDDRLKKIADFFDLPLEYLASGGDSRPDLSERSAHLVWQRVKDPRLTDALDRYFELPEDKKQDVLDYIDFVHGKSKQAD